MIRILFFAQLREQLNCAELEWHLTQSVSVNELRSLLIQAHPQWKEFLAQNSILCAVNQSMSKSDQLIHPSDEVAFFPPVTGG